MEDFYDEGARSLQDRFDTRRLVDRIRERLVRDHLTDDDRAFATPAPSWKRSEWAADSLPAGDPARDLTREAIRT
jgi:hypothetical protein